MDTTLSQKVAAATLTSDCVALFIPGLTDIRESVSFLINRADII